MKRWAILLGAAAAVGTAFVVITLVQKLSLSGEASEDVPAMIQDCFDRIHRIEDELHRLRTAPDTAG